MNDNCPNCKDTAHYNVELEAEIASLRESLKVAIQAMEECSALPTICDALVKIKNKHGEI